MNIKLECPSCNQDFDNRHRIPKMLTTCGHTICKVCLDSLSENYQNYVCVIDHMVVLFLYNIEEH
jgi:hypothetical protein